MKAYKRKHAWTKDDIKILKRASKDKISVEKLGKMLRREGSRARTEGAIRMMAHKHQLPIGHVR